MVTIKNENAFKVNFSEEEILAKASTPQIILDAAKVMLSKKEQEIDFARPEMNARTAFRALAIRVAVGKEPSANVAEAWETAQKFDCDKRIVAFEDFGEFKVEIQLHGNTFPIKEEIKKDGFKFNLGLWRKTIWSK